MSPTGTANPRFIDLVKDDVTPWYKKPNLRRLYLFLVPAAMGVEWTSGFDGSIMNGLQAVDSWDKCMFSIKLLELASADQTYTKSIMSQKISVTLEEQFWVS